MGDRRPPAEFRTGAFVATVQTACKHLATEIERGTDEWGQTPKICLVALLRLFLATVADCFILKTVNRTHHRPPVGAPANKKRQ